MKKWHLKSQALKKYSLGHPWVFSNDLNHSPKNISPGELIELYAEGGEFLASGYGHPNTLIAFRILNRDSNQAINSEFFYQRFVRALEKRRLAGVEQQSFRFIFAEADSLPGLIIDRYKMLGDSQAFVIQSSTAGMDLLLPFVLEGLEQIVQKNFKISWGRTGVILSNDSKSRLMEGILVEPKKIERDLEGVNWSDLEIEIAPALKTLPIVKMNVDLLGGQKTGFFLDQRSNIELLIKTAEKLFAGTSKTLRVLDLCCYNGQWSSQIANLFKSLEIKAEFTCVDASEKALLLAKRNLEKFGIEGEQLKFKKLDVLKELQILADQSYDIVICDPPAFIKKKQDIPNGERAYMKLNRDAMKKTAMGGVFMSCSCSGHLDDAKFREVLLQAGSRSGSRIEWLWRGTHSPDHPELVEFPQGTYLKSWMGWMK
jgi:23S rRNA (cytosine1962-C5)-methyltransferase